MRYTKLIRPVLIDIYSWGIQCKSDLYRSIFTHEVYNAIPSFVKRCKFLYSPNEVSKANLFCVEWCKFLYLPQTVYKAIPSCIECWKCLYSAHRCTKLSHFVLIGIHFYILRKMSRIIIIIKFRPARDYVYTAVWNECIWFCPQRCASKTCARDIVVCTAVGNELSGIVSTDAPPRHVRETDLSAHL